MAKNFVQPGRVVTITAAADVASGALVEAGEIVGVATHGAKSGEPLELALDGVWELAKVSAQAWATVGLPIYSASGNATSTKSTNKLIGVNIATAANPSGTGLVRLNGAFAITSSGS